ECAAILRALEDRWNLAVALLSQARAALAQGDPRRAAELNREGLQLALAGRLQRHVAAGLEATAALVLEEVRSPKSEVRSPTPAASERLEQSVRLLGAAAALRHRVGSSVLPADQGAYSALVGAFRDRLGSEAFDAALSAGRDLSMEDAVALADSLLAPP
ncbi:MAG TPA: hypothetical protein VH257_19015, partial [Chloroflexota bacterium]|nr:hypothetical protein [Chloroflexota bacterium]